MKFTPTVPTVVAPSIRIAEFIYSAVSSAIAPPAVETAHPYFPVKCMQWTLLIRSSMVLSPRRNRINIDRRTKHNTIGIEQFLVKGRDIVVVDTLAFCIAGYTRRAVLDHQGADINKRNIRTCCTRPSSTPIKAARLALFSFGAPVYTDIFMEVFTRVVVFSGPHKGYGEREYEN